MMLLAPLTLVLFIQQRQNESFAQCEEPSIPERTRGNYENKIRFYSPPEKTFEIFANKKSEDGGELRHQDRPHAARASLVDRIAGRQAAPLARRVGIVNEQDPVLHDEAHERQHPDLGKHGQCHAGDRKSTRLNSSHSSVSRMPSSA